jgi:subtilisin family serine protease
VIGWCWLAGLLLQPNAIAQFRPNKAPDGPASFRPDRILVKPKRGTALPALEVLHQATGCRVQRHFSAIGNWQVLQLPPEAEVKKFIARYHQSGLVDDAEPDFIVQALIEPNDFRFGDGSLWSLRNTGIYGGVPGADIKAPQAWDTLNNASSILVAIIDSGVRATHEDLAPNLWVNPGEIPGNGIDDDGNGYVDDVHGINTLLNNGNPDDDYGHGSHVSGILGAVGNNGVGVVGVCWRVQIMACKFLDAHGDGSISDAVKCIDYARNKGAKIINASWGSTTFTSQALYDAIASARDAGILFVAACGNSQGNNDVEPLYPASYDLDNIIAVAATTRTDDLAVFSNYGATKVDLAAPGSPIFSCWSNADNAYQYFEGTSMAAPHVAGACALLQALRPNENYQQIIQRILDTVDPLPSLAGKCATGGRLNLWKAVIGGSLPPVTTVTVTDANASRVGPDPGEFIFTRAGSTNTALTVNFSFSGTAIPNEDFRGTQGNLPATLTIPAGARSATLGIVPLPSANVIGAKTSILTLTANAAYVIGTPTSASIGIAGNRADIGGINRVVGGNIRLMWATIQGKGYRVACKNSLSELTWANLSGVITATGTSVSWTDTNAGAPRQRFYTVYVVN